MQREALFVISAAAVAQLGERQTEHMKVPGSIQGLGSSSMYCIIGQCITYFSCRWGTIAHLNVTKRYVNRFVIGCLAAWFSIPGAALLCSAATYSTHVANLRKMLELGM